MSRIIVTGGSGFLGTNLVQHLRDHGNEVLNADIAHPRNAAHVDLWRKVDLLDATALSRTVEGFAPDYVVHMAARTDLRGRSVEDYQANTVGVSNLINAVRRVPGLKRVVFASSMLVCKLGYRPRSDVDYCPTTAYGQSKVECERIIRNQAGDVFPWIIVRPTSIWGPWFDVPYRDFFTAVSKGVYFHPKGRAIKRSYGFVGNTIFQITRLLHCPLQAASSTFYLADYDPIDLKEWATMIQRAFGARPVNELPVMVLKAGAKVGDMLLKLGYRSPPLTSFRLDNLLTDAVYDLDPLKAVCGPTPYGAKEGVAQTVGWIRQVS